MSLGFSWFRRRVTYYDETNFLGECANDNDPRVKLQGYRHREPDEICGDRMTQSMISDPGFSRRSQSPIDVSLALSEDSTITITELNDRNALNAKSINATPVMRRRRSHMSARQRNYRILDPNESRLVFQQHNDNNLAANNEEKRSTLLRRRKSSSNSQKVVEVPQTPMIITPPVLMSRSSFTSTRSSTSQDQECCTVCQRQKRNLRPNHEVTNRTQSFPADFMASSTTRQIGGGQGVDEESARLSFVSSSTGYSSARSSLRSSDGGNDETNNNRDSAISTSFSLSSQSSARRSALLSKGALTQLDRIAIELLDTERAYVEDLNAVIKGYMDFLVEEREKLKVTLDAISSLFGCIERIFAFNKQLFHQLDSTDLDCIKMSGCFVENSGKFEDYIAYCTNYHRMMATLCSLQQQNNVARALQERQIHLGHSLPLSAYLLKPVQRILKYHLFLENILKNLPNTTNLEDMTQVKKAYEVMTSQAARINDEKKRAEHIERVGQLQSTLQKWKADEIQISNLSAYGDLLLEAPFRQAGSKTTRLLFLFEEMLLIVKQRGSNYVCKDYIMCSNLMLNEWICPEEPLSFQVLSFDNPRVQYIFMATSMDQKRTWMQELKRAMLDHYSIEIPEKTKQLMLSIDNTKMIPFGRPEFAEVSMKNHKKVPKYLEKRRKSVDAKDSEAARRRSLSASRLLSNSKTSISEPVRHEDQNQKCTCHMNGGAFSGTSPSTSKIISASSQNNNNNSDHNTTRIVARTQSALTIDFPISQPIEPAEPPTSAAVLSSRSRYQQARNRRLPPRHTQESRSSSGRRLGEEEIDRTFDQLYADLVSFDDSINTNSKPPLPPPAQVRGIRGKSECPAESISQIKIVAAPATAMLNVPECQNPRVRSKSLTRLDEYETEPICLKPSIERRYSKLDQMKKKAASRKYQVNHQEAEVLRTPRLSMADSEILIHGEEPYRRHRAPLTAQQADDYFPKSCHQPTVMSIIRQYENA
ncbi:unnamed protein product [Caenorhabditis angaria]|uniref:DH domain-containing protein n=1 Tax=Caenorhabditis angaria TaxID=860376 RepID=A0A9P1ITN3_9PELO|nr:unnamed protein product [Caenorhabditis angaria]